MWIIMFIFIFVFYCLLVCCLFVCLSLIRWLVANLCFLPLFPPFSVLYRVVLFYPLIFYYYYFPWPSAAVVGVSVFYLGNRSAGWVLRGKKEDKNEGQKDGKYSFINGRSR